MLKAATALIFAALAASCQTAPQEKKPFDICSDGLRLLGNPTVSDWQKLSLYESMRNSGCMQAK